MTAGEQRCQFMRNKKSRHSCCDVQAQTIAWWQEQSADRLRFVYRALFSFGFALFQNQLAPYLLTKSLLATSVSSNIRIKSPCKTMWIKISL